MPAKGSAGLIIQVAKTQIGVIEGPKDNETKYGAFTKANFQPWCGSFVMWCASQAGVKIPNTVYTPGGAAAFQKAGQWISAPVAPKPGDIAYFDFPGDGVDRISHVGIVVKDNGDGTCITIEGNTASDAKGNQRNGGEVCQKVRGYAKNKKGIMVSIVGFGRPKYVADDFTAPVGKQIAGAGLAAAVAIGGGQAANNDKKEAPKKDTKPAAVADTSTVTITPVVFPATLSWVDADGKTITVVLQIPNDTKASNK
jgi:hypothetical protein